MIQVQTVIELHVGLFQEVTVLWCYHFSVQNLLSASAYVLALDEQSKWSLASWRRGPGEKPDGAPTGSYKVHAWRISKIS